MDSSAVHDVFGLAGRTLEQRFLIDRPIAEGGFGVVYYGQQAALERPIALKVLKTPPRFDELAKKQFLAGFAAEAKTIARITHPNIVLVYDFGVSIMPSGERAAWMALEWLTGITLDDELSARRGRGGRTPAECLELLRPALSALAVVHAAGVAHRDLKPANIMLVPGPAGLTPKLLDFGIAKIMAADEAPGSGQTRTRSDQIAFSPAYASPEQISQGRSGPWTDVHAMGLILTEMLIDRPPLDATEPGLLFQQIVDRVRPTPARFGITVGAWEGVLSRSLAVSPSERYRDSSELLRALEGTLAETTATLTRLASSSRPTEGGPASDTVGLMSTLRAPSAGSEGESAETGPRSQVTTTSTPTSNDPSLGVPAAHRWRPAPYLIGIALAVTAAGVVGYRATIHSQTPTVASAGVVRPVDVVVSPPSASATPTPPPTPRTPSTPEPPAASASGPSPSASTPAPSATPPPAPKATPRPPPRGTTGGPGSSEGRPKPPPPGRAPIE